MGVNVLEDFRERFFASKRDKKKRQTLLPLDIDVPDAWNFCTQFLTKQGPAWCQSQYPEDDRTVKRIWIFDDIVELLN